MTSTTDQDILDDQLGEDAATSSGEVVDYGSEDTLGKLGGSVSTPNQPSTPEEIEDPSDADLAYDDEEEATPIDQGLA